MSQTVARAIDVIRFVADRPRTLSEVADFTGTHKSTALRTLQTLVAEDFARQDATGRYRLGFGLIALAGTALDDLEVRQLARPHLQRLVDELGHTVHLAQLEGDRIRYIDKLEGRGTVAMGSRVGNEVLLHTAGVAKAVLAHVGEDERRRILQRATFTRFTANTIVTPEHYEAELAVTLERGWAEDDGENEEYINCVAVPVVDARNQVTVAFSVTALRAVAPLAALREVVPLLQATSQDLSRELGWKP